VSLNRIEDHESLAVDALVLVEGILCAQAHRGETGTEVGRASAIADVDRLEYLHATGGGWQVCRCRDLVRALGTLPPLLQLVQQVDSCSVEFGLLPVQLRDRPALGVPD